jgi:hypothetical protein
MAQEGSDPYNMYVEIYCRIIKQNRTEQSRTGLVAHFSGCLMTVR